MPVDPRPTAVAAEAAFLDAHPPSARRRARRAPRVGVRAPRRARRGLPRLRRRQPVRDVAGRGAPARCCARPSSATRTRSTRRRRPPTALVERARAAVLRYFNARRERVRLHLHRRTPPARCGSSARRIRSARRPVPGDRRQPQLGQRHPRVRPGEGRTDRVRAARGARSARRRRRCSSGYLDDADAGGHNLFAYPAQSNFSGVKHPLEWIAAAQERGWDVLVDGAAFVPTNRLDLSVWTPDFVAISFYKLFGYPTGLGALLARREALRAAASARGSAAAPSSRRTSGATWSCRSPATPGSRTARSTTSASRRSRSGCATSSGSASTRSRGASRRSGPGCSTALRRLRHADGEPGGPHLRPGDVGRPRRRRSR